jgi:hypothetical protein
MTKSALHKLSPKNGVDDPSLLRVMMTCSIRSMKDTKDRCLFNKAKHVEALGAAGPQEVTGKSNFNCYPKELARRQRTDEQEILDLAVPWSAGKEAIGGELGRDRARSRGRRLGA